MHASMPKDALVRCYTCSLLSECLGDILNTALSHWSYFLLSDGFDTNGKIPRTHQLLWRKLFYCCDGHHIQSFILECGKNCIHIVVIVTCRNFTCFAFHFIPVTWAVDRKIFLEAPRVGKHLKHLSLHPSWSIQCLNVSLWYHWVLSASFCSYLIFLVLFLPYFEPF